MELSELYLWRWLSLFGTVSYGAMLGFTVAGINIQPSELVKIVFVFFVASSFKHSTEFKDIVVTTARSSFSRIDPGGIKDLGAALIIFVVYLVMLYVATHQPLYMSCRTWRRKLRSSCGISFVYAR